MRQFPLLLSCVCFWLVVVCDAIIPCPPRSAGAVAGDGSGSGCVPIPMGAHCVSSVCGGGLQSDAVECSFRVWLPHATAVVLVGPFNAWNTQITPDNAQFVMISDPSASGYWYLTNITTVKAAVYKYYIYNTNAVVNNPYQIDPYCRAVDENNYNNCFIHDPSWTVPTYSLSRTVENLIIYELHVETFTAAGTFNALAAQLPYLAGLGIGAIELMPIHQNPVQEFGPGWGYGPQSYFPVEAYYCRDVSVSVATCFAVFQQFVHLAHSYGLAVILDVVLNHMIGGSNFFEQIDGWGGQMDGTWNHGIYFYPDSYSTPWGPRPAYNETNVQAFLLDYLILTMEQTGVDGFRIDSVSCMREVGPPGDQNCWDSGPTVMNLPGAPAFIQTLTSTVRSTAAALQAQHRPNLGLTIAEDLADFATITNSAEAGGLGFSLQWTTDLASSAVNIFLGSATISALANTLANIGAPSSKYVCYTESHDVAGNTARVAFRIMQYIQTHFVNLSSSDQLALMYKQTSLSFLTVFTSNCLPMLFQGQEWATNQTFVFYPTPVLLFPQPTDGSAQGYVALSRRVFYIRSNLFALFLKTDGSSITSVYHVDSAANVLAYARCNGDCDERAAAHSCAVIVMNIGGEDFINGYRIGLPAGGLWHVLLRSDSSDWSPLYSGTYDYEKSIHADGGPFTNHAHSATLHLGPYSAVILSRTSL